MKKIERLTKKQIAMMSVWRDKWIEIGLSTEPADRPAAEAAIVSIYGAAKLRPPRVVWCGSPLSQGLTRSVVRASVGDSVRASVGDSVRASVWASVFGSHEAGWIAFYDFFREIGLTDKTAPLIGLTGLCRSAGWALPHAGLCWVSERHSTLRRDANGRLHSEAAAAVEYPDGWRIHAWHGTRVPAEWIEDKAKLDPATALTWKNVEQRRAAAEIIGWAKILATLKPKSIDKDLDPEIGELLEVNLPDSPACRFLRVTCGTKREFVLPVPREMKTALQANAWSYNVDGKLLLQKEART